MTKKLNILLVDDDIVDVMNMKRIFRQKEFSHSLYIAHNGEEALQLMDENTIPMPHVILLDLNMPRMGGIEFLKVIRNNPRYQHIHVVVLTTSDEESYKRLTQQYNIAAYIIKPLLSKAFADEVHILNNSWQMVGFPD